MPATPVQGKTVKRGDRKFVDYLLFYKSNLPLAIIEAKDNSQTIGSGMQQATQSILSSLGTIDSLTCQSHRATEPLSIDPEHAHEHRIRAESDGRYIRVHRSQDSPRC